MDLETENMNYESFVEAYCLLSSYTREDGKVGAKYNIELLKEFVKFMADMMADPDCFDTNITINPERNRDGSLKNPPTPEHDGTGLA